jgi:hypothetical protein
MSILAPASNRSWFLGKKIAKDRNLIGRSSK